MARRVRRHANPFNCRVDLGEIDRLDLFGRQAPLEVELGPGSGSFLFSRAANNPERDFVGIEVRKPMVDQAMGRRADGGPSNAVILYGNANLNLELAAPGIIERFHVHFPDPWVKKRHWKRRVVQPQVVRRLAELLSIGGQIYAQSDVQALAAEMYKFFAAERALVSLLDPSMLVPRPFPEFTDWERHHERNDEPVYRMLFEKRQAPSGEIPDIEVGPTGPLVGV